MTQKKKSCESVWYLTQKKNNVFTLLQKFTFFSPFFPQKNDKKSAAKFCKMWQNVFYEVETDIVAVRHFQMMDITQPNQIVKKMFLYGRVLRQRAWENVIWTSHNKVWILCKLPPQMCRVLLHRCGLDLSETFLLVGKCPTIPIPEAVK